MQSTEGCSDSDISAELRGSLFVSRFPETFGSIMVLMTPYDSHFKCFTNINSIAQDVRQSYGLMIEKCSHDLNFDTPAC